MFNMDFVRKYMLTAKLFGELKNPCYSRKIGVVILNANLTKVVGMGYNGPPRGAPHCDSPEHLKNIFLPQLTDEDKNCISKNKNSGMEVPRSGRSYGKWHPSRSFYHSATTSR